METLTMQVYWPGAIILFIVLLLVSIVVFLIKPSVKSAGGFIVILIVEAVISIGFSRVLEPIVGPLFDRIIYSSDRIVSYTQVPSSITAYPLNQPRSGFQEQEKYEVTSTMKPVEATENSVTTPDVFIRPQLTYIYFYEGSFPKGIKLYTYSAPSKSSWHQISSKTKKAVHGSTNDTVWVAGKDNGWVLVRYEIGSKNDHTGQYRMGYEQDYTSGFNNLTLDSYHGTITSTCNLTDGVSIITLPSGTNVTVLGRMDIGIYVETNYNGQTARGTVDENCIDWY